jgi:tetratricopeptide (TPR) repeat protein
MYLEQESHFDEADDALQTMIEIAAGRLQPSDAISAWMRLGRVRRKQTDFDRADAAYAEAGRIAGTVGDRQSILLSRIGRSNVVYFRGNLAESEAAWRAVLHDANMTEFRNVQAQAEHGLGTALTRRGQAYDGAPHLWRAYELYEDDSQQLRTLNDLGMLLLSIGDVAGAERALKEVVRREHLADNLANAKIELMNCASFRRDRVSFERWREQALNHLDTALPNIRTDYHLKAGIGLARFGNPGRAEKELRRALEIATAHELHEFVFRIERIQGGLRDCCAPHESESAESEPVAAPTDALRELSVSLASLGT